MVSLVVPNGKLANATVNNLGTLRHRVFAARLAVAHATTTNALAAFMDGLMGLIAKASHIRPESVNVSMTSIGPDGVEIELVCCLDVRTTDDERADRTALRLGVLRLSDRMRIRPGNQDSAAAAAREAVAA